MWNFRVLGAETMKTRSYLLYTLWRLWRHVTGGVVRLYTAVSVWGRRPSLQVVIAVKWRLQLHC